MVKRKQRPQSLRSWTVYHFVRKFHKSLRYATATNLEVCTFTLSFDLSPRSSFLFLFYYFARLRVDKLAPLNSKVLDQLTKGWTCLLQRSFDRTDKRNAILLCNFYLQHIGEHISVSCRQAMMIHSSVRV